MDQLDAIKLLIIRRALRENKVYEPYINILETAIQLSNPGMISYYEIAKKVESIVEKK